MLRIILDMGYGPAAVPTGSASPTPQEMQMNDFFSPVAQRAQLSTHSAGHSNALVENPFDEVEATEAD